MAAEDVERISQIVRLPPRRRDAHKGDFGHVLVVGGSRGMIGAVALAANAALRGGAGLVTFAAPETIQRQVATLCPCATSIPLACEDNGELSQRAVSQLAEAASRCDVLALGPGFAIGGAQKNIVRWALGQDKPAVIDADGLNNLAGIDDWPVLRRCPLALTPHPGEFSRLTGLPTQDIVSDREGSAVNAVRKWLARAPKDAGSLTGLLKGAGTVVTDGGRMYVNSTGNPGMASGGSGDVLTGLLAALIGQGLGLFEAACLAAHCHGRAGDIAAGELGEISLIATDLLEFLPKAMKEVAG